MTNDNTLRIIFLFDLRVLFNVIEHLHYVHASIVLVSVEWIFQVFSRVVILFINGVE